MNKNSENEDNNKYDFKKNNQELNNDIYEREDFLYYIKKEFSKLSQINDRTFTLFNEYISDEMANYTILKENIINEDFNCFALCMREYGIIVPYQKVLFDLSKKYFSSLKNK